MTSMMDGREMTYKEEGTAQLQRIDGNLFGRGFSVGNYSSIPFESGPDTEFNERVQAAIKREQERFPDNPEVFTKEFIVGITLGTWVAMKNVEIQQ